MTTVRTLSLAGALIGLLLTGVVVYAQSVMARSLPRLDGQQTLDCVEDTVHIERDDLGSPRIRADSLLDAVAAQGFVHAQDRYFQMDMYRRVAAGRLAEIVGKPAVSTDISMRRHRFNDVAAGVLERMPPEQSAMLDAYACGVNAGLHALDAPSPEYVLMGLGSV